MNTQQPIVTGTSVIAVKYNDGVVLAADNMASYGSLMRFNNVERLIKVGDETVVGISGDISDMQKIEQILEKLEIEESYNTERPFFRANHVHSYLTKILYNRRSKMNPLWNSCIVAGLDDKDEVFLKYVDLLGVTYSSPSIATGFGAYLAVPLLRQVVDKESDVENLNEQDAVELVKKCMKVLFYRDARSSDKYSLSVISKSRKKSDLFTDQRCEDMNWGFAKEIKGYGTQNI